MLLGFLLVILILVCIALGGVILLQRSEGGALGMGGGPSGFMTARGAGDLLTRTTWILAGVFFALCLSLTLLSGHLRSGGSVVDRLKVDALNPDALAPKAPLVPAVVPGAPAPLDAPRPQVNVAPAAAGAAAPRRAAEIVAPAATAGARTPPPTTTSTGATSPVSRALGIPGAEQTAPQAQPTTPAKPATSSAAPASPAGSAPVSGAPAQ